MKFRIGCSVWQRRDEQTRICRDFLHRSQLVDFTLVHLELRPNRDMKNVTSEPTGLSQPNLCHRDAQIQ